MFPSSTVENYLKAIYHGETQLAAGERLLPMGQLATALGVAPGTATTMVKALAESGLVEYEPYNGVRLSAAGERLATLVLRRHRLIELFLVRVMGLGWHEVHDDAEQLEHVVSDRLIQRIDEMLGHPEVDPHGDPIPTADGHVPRDHFETLLTCPVHHPVVVSRVTDQDAAFLRFIEAAGISLYAAQEEAILEIMEGRHVVLNTPTGSGKSLVATAMHFRSMCLGLRSVYTCPIKALVSEKFFEACELFGAENVGMSTGDTGINRDAEGMLYLNESYALPYEGCWSDWVDDWGDQTGWWDLDSNCSFGEVLDTIHYPLGDYHVFDVLPNGLTAFTQMQWSSYTTPRMPGQADPDNDGLTTTDPSNLSWDADGDGLSDLSELSYDEVRALLVQEGFTVTRATGLHLELLLNWFSPLPKLDRLQRAWNRPWAVPMMRALLAAGSFLPRYALDLVFVARRN